MDEAVALADWRLRVAALYLAEPSEGEAGAASFRRGRDLLFRDHPQSPLDAGQRARFAGLAWFPYDPAARVVAEPRPADTGEELAIDTGGEDGAVRYRRVGRLVAAARHLTPPGEPLFAQVAAGNAASLRAVGAAGFRPLGAEVLFDRGA